MLVSFLRVVCISTFLASASLALAQESVLYDVTLDIDKDGLMDRAALVLVGPKPAKFTDAAKAFYILSEGERADLLIYLGRGDRALDIYQKPDLRKDGLIEPEELRFIMPLESNTEGALIVVKSNGFGNADNATETLTIVNRDRKFVVSGYATAWSLSDDSSDCAINFLAGKATKRENDDPKGKVLKARFRIITVADWSDATRPGLCEE
jgi:hypothetical protein